MYAPDLVIGLGVGSSLTLEVGDHALRVIPNLVTVLFRSEAPVDVFSVAENAWIELADFVRVSGAELRDGLLAIDLVREIPEAMKARKIDIGGGEPTTIEATPSEEKAKAKETATA